jgi:UDP-N-acetylglucosamine pyrophosphorylase
MTKFEGALREDMLAKGVDPELTASILDAYNAGTYDATTQVQATGVPKVDGKSVVDAKAPGPFRFGAGAKDALGRLGLVADEWLEPDSSGYVASRERLERLGLRLYEFTAFGVLNGGSATSYADGKKNLAFGERAFAAYRKPFEALAPLCLGKPKGVTPAYLNPDGSPGESFLLVKFRSLLSMKLAYEAAFGRPSREALPLFQMTSEGTDAALKEAYAEWKRHPWLKGAAELGIDPTGAITAVQPLIAAYTHSSEGRPKRVFDRAYGKPDSVIALPGGHGQSFRVLSGVFRDLRARGYRYAYFGNVDNLACLPDPFEIATLALSGEKAGFDFSYRTPVDVKGGVLVLDGRGKKNCADIGPAISFSEVQRLEGEGERILFNCATGLFDLEWLVPELDYISASLPVRFTDQDKDAGKYSQAEQVTWEIMGMLDSFLGFAVDKFDRFIAAKLLMETIFSSGARADGDPGLSAELTEASKGLARGLARILSEKAGLELVDGRWAPKA